MGNASSRADAKERRRERKQLAAAAAALAKSYGHASLAEAFIEQAASARDAEANQVHNALLTSRIENDRVRERHGAFPGPSSARSGRSHRSHRRPPPSFTTTSESLSEDAFDAESTMPCSPTTTHRTNSQANRLTTFSGSSSGRNRLRTISSDSLTSDTSAVDSFLARAESVLSAQQGSNDRRASDPEPRRMRRIRTLQQKEEEELAMALAVSASEAEAVAAALDEPISLADAEAIAAAQAELDGLTAKPELARRGRTESTPPAQLQSLVVAQPPAAAAAAAAPASRAAVPAGAPLRQRFVTLTPQEKASIEATEAKARLRRTVSAAPRMKPLSPFAEPGAEADVTKLRPRQVELAPALPLAPETPVKVSPLLAREASFTTSVQSSAHASLDGSPLPPRSGHRSSSRGQRLRTNSRGSQGSTQGAMNQEAVQHVADYLATQGQMGAAGAGVEEGPSLTARVGRSAAALRSHSGASAAALAAHVPPSSAMLRMS